MRKKLLFIAAVLSLFALSSCGGKPVVTSNKEPTVIKLSWWGNDDRNEYTIEAVRRFEKLHPDIMVECNYSEWSGYETRYNAQMVSNTEADVMQINYAWIRQFSENGDGFYDLNKLSDNIDLSNFSEEDLDFGMQNGKLNGLPIALNTQTVYINKTIYNEYGLDIPASWDDFFNAAGVMNGKVYPIAMTDKPAWFFIVSYAEQTVGKQFMTIDGKLNFNKDDIKIMLEFYCRLVNEKVMPQIEYFDKMEIENGAYAGCLAWVSDASGYMERAIDKGYEIIVADYPVMDNAKLSWYAKPATMYAISVNTSYPEESAILLDFLLNSDEMAELQQVEKGVPLSESARKYLSENDMLNGIQYEAFLKMSDYSDRISVVSPYFENMDLIDIFLDGCNSVLYDKVGSEEKAAELYDSFKKILN